MLVGRGDPSKAKTRELQGAHSVHFDRDRAKHLFHSLTHIISACVSKIGEMAYFISTVFCRNNFRDRDWAAHPAAAIYSSYVPNWLDKIDLNKMRCCAARICRCVRLYTGF